MSSNNGPRVAILSGSPSDSQMVEACAEVLEHYGIAHESAVLSAHRQPAALHAYVEEVEARGCELYIAMAGLAAHLPGVVASLTAKPVLGVPLAGGVMEGMDALLSVVQMPGGVPVACFAVGKAGAKNAGHMAARILANSDEELATKVQKFRHHMAEGGR